MSTPESGTNSSQELIRNASTESPDPCRRGRILTALLTTICAFVLAGILVAGLWPFHAPRNAVSWLSPSNGVFLGKHGSVVSAGAFKAGSSQVGNSCTVELWLQPYRIISTGTILAFYQPETGVTSFSLRQSWGDLILQRISQDQSPRKAKLYTHFFNSPNPVFVTITSSESGTAIYVDGVLLRKSPTFRFLRTQLTGQLLIGNAPATVDSWSGQIRTLAFYDHELPSSEVLQHFIDRTKGMPASTSEGAIASYPFDEANGNVVHSKIVSAPYLSIPERFFVVNHPFLERPWDEFFPVWSYWEDVAVNIAGFIPLGFCFGAYFSMIRRTKRATWLTIMLGFAVSLTIEVLQSYLPTRNSGMTDLFTNTWGTALGAILWTWSMKQDWLQALLVRISKREDVPGSSYNS